MKPIKVEKNRKNREDIGNHRLENEKFQEENIDMKKTITKQYIHRVNFNWAYNFNG